MAKELSETPSLIIHRCRENELILEPEGQQTLLQREKNLLERREKKKVIERSREPAMLTAPDTS